MWKQQEDIFNQTCFIFLCFFAYLYRPSSYMNKLSATGHRQAEDSNESLLGSLLNDLRHQFSNVGSIAAGMGRMGVGDFCLSLVLVSMSGHPNVTACARVMGAGMRCIPQMWNSSFSPENTSVTFVCVCADNRIKSCDKNTAGIYEVNEGRSRWKLCGLSAVCACIALRIYRHFLIKRSGGEVGSLGHGVLQMTERLAEGNKVITTDCSLLRTADKMTKEKE